MNELLLVRLERELETLRLALKATHYINARNALTRAQTLVTELRESR